MDAFFDHPGVIDARGRENFRGRVDENWPRAQKNWGTGAHSCRHQKRRQPEGRDATEAGWLACALAPFEPMELEKSLIRSIKHLYRGL